VEEILQQGLIPTFEKWSGTPRLVLYAHGGLNNEKTAASRIAGLRPYFLANEIYPLHFMWETGMAETIKSIVADAFHQRRFAGMWDRVKERLQDLADEGIELATRPMGRALWGEMNQNARLASDDDGGADYVAGRLAQLQQDGHRFELHLVGHSAGSILLGHLLPKIISKGFEIKSFTLYAPACTTELFRQNYLPHLDQIGRLTIFNLNDEHERDDNVYGVYNKSLLYLAPNGFRDTSRSL
jgi:hypothetical protein